MVHIKIIKIKISWSNNVTGLLTPWALNLSGAIYRNTLCRLNGIEHPKD